MKQTPQVPPLFKQIVEHHAKVDAMRAAPVVDFKEWRETKRDGDFLRRAAERALSWNADKGRTA